MLNVWFTAILEWDRWTDLAISIGIFLFFLIIRKLITKYLFSFITRKIKRSDNSLMWTEAFERPLRAFFISLGLYIAITYFASSSWSLLYWIERIFRSWSIILIGWGIFNLSAASSSLLESVMRRFGLDESSMLIPFLSRTLRVIVVILIVTIVGSEWGFSINGVVAGMGLGSLAIALAAKDTLSNILGGIVLILEKPFSKGDWILTPTTEGFVEDITFRSSKIRTFADALVTVPNSTLANEPITNWSRMGRRRVTFTLNVALDTERHRLHNAVRRLEESLQSNERIDKRTIFVKFNEFNEHGLGIMVYFFTKSTVWGEYLAERESFNLYIMQIFEEEGIRLASPLQRVFVEQASARTEMHFMKTE